MPPPLGASKVPGTANQQPLSVPRGRLKLVIQLPVGSEAASYEVQIRKQDESAIVSGKAQARIEAGITKLLIEIDTRSIQAGDYQIAWRLDDFDWRFYPIQLR